ncbi:uncharacterized protein [Lolium perenne]|uniref:uncharacterized protein n=1 Tax=Lolium perenne TaxID=4522 RepID=UPI0021F58FB8|nr:uncharacterized protein LOC127347982 [Lolium perenne]
MAVTLVATLEAAAMEDAMVATTATVAMEAVVAAMAAAVATAMAAATMAMEVVAMEAATKGAVATPVALVDRARRFDHAYGGEEEHHFANHASTSYQMDPSWYMESRATNHITRDLERLHTRDGYNGNDCVQDLQQLASLVITSITYPSLPMLGCLRTVVLVPPAPDREHRMQTRLLAGKTVPKQRTDGGVTYSAARVMDGEPSSVRAALQTPAWKATMDEEYSALQRNQTWRLVPARRGLNIIDSRWVYKVKHKPDGFVDRLKARLIAKRFKQHHGIDYDDTYNLVIKPTTIRVVSALAFFRGQHTLASDRTWLASYQFRGAAQTWYYSLEQDEGSMPPWDRFRELCLLRFGPLIRGSRLAELGCLAFTTMVQDFADRFQALACHAPEVTGQQHAELFIGGLPDHIRVDVELQAPRDLQTAMHYARAFERRTQAVQQVPPARGRRTTPASTSDRGRHPPHPARLERRRLGLCFNCDDPYTPGHVCPRLFYLETVDADEADATPETAAATVEPAESTPAAATAFVVSLHTLVGIRHERTMLLPVTIHGETLVALLDTGSTHNFLPAATMRRLELQPMDGDHLRVTVANGDRLHCHGLAQHVPLTIDDEHFTITCADINLGCFDFILGVDFLRTLGPILWDFDALTMTFWRQGRRIRWEGLGGAAPAPQLQLVSGHDDAEHPLLTHLLQQHGDIFEESQALPPPRACDHRIHLLPGSAPVVVRPYRYPQLQKDELERQCALMLAASIIKISTSPFSALVLLVRKSDGSWRNALTLKDKFPIPVVDELFDELHGARFFTKIGLRSGYHQVRMHPEDIAKTAFQTHHGHFEFVTSWAEHLQHIAIVFNELRAQRLHLKCSKCSFGTTSVAYLGHVISADGVAMDADKVAAVAAWPTPHSPRTLRGFLGLAGYYRKFIRDFGLIASPLTRLLRHNAFAWDNEATAAFEALKGALTTGPVLQMPDFDRPFIIDCDASGAGFGAVLHQGDGPLAYFSRPFAARHLKLAAYEQELIGLRLSTVRQHQWISKLFGFDFTVEYHPGRLNTVADTLSRRDAEPDTAEGASEGRLLCIRSGPSFALFDLIRQATTTVLDAQLLRQQLDAGELDDPWRFVDGLLLHGRRVFVPDHDDLRHQVLLLAHSAGHEGV